MKRQNSISPNDITNFLLEGALWRKGDDIYLFWGPFESREFSDNDEFSIGYSDFFDQSGWQAFKPNRVEVISIAECASILNDFREHCELPQVDLPLWQEASFDSFKQSFSVIEKAILNQEIYKAVPIVFEKSNQLMSQALKLHLVSNLLKAPINLNLFGFWQATMGFLGASPEILFEKSGTVVRTMALAGTLPRFNSSGEDVGSQILLNDPKELLEHKLVVDDISTVLSQIGTVERGATSVLELPHLYHLHTSLQASEVKSFNLKSMIELLHPTPALGVAPRAVGHSWLLQLPEQSDRQNFGAPFVVKAREHLSAIVAIRQIQWDECGMRIGSGCGQVLGSILEKEWQELMQKRISVKKLLGLI